MAYVASDMMEAHDIICYVKVALLFRSVCAGLKDSECSKQKKEGKKTYKARDLKCWALSGVWDVQGKQGHLVWEW